MKLLTSSADFITKNGFTIDQEQTLIKETEIAKNSAESFVTINELMLDLENN